MTIMTIMDRKTGTQLEIEFFNNVYEARQRAIRLAGYAGYLNFVKDSYGDAHADNKIYSVDLMRA
jgi:hypothetical protein